MFAFVVEVILSGWKRLSHVPFMTLSRRRFKFEINYIMLALFRVCVCLVVVRFVSARAFGYLARATRIGVHMHACVCVCVLFETVTCRICGVRVRKPVSYLTTCAARVCVCVESPA